MSHVKKQWLLLLFKIFLIKLLFLFFLVLKPCFQYTLLCTRASTRARDPTPARSVARGFLATIMRKSTSGPRRRTRHTVVLSAVAATLQPWRSMGSTNTRAPQTSSYVCDVCKEVWNGYPTGRCIGPLTLVSGRLVGKIVLISSPLLYCFCFCFWDHHWIQLYHKLRVSPPSPFGT